MKKIVSLMAIIVLLMNFSVPAFSQITLDTTSLNNNRPHIEIKVNKVYDENGNVIEYDSTYVWSYSNSSGDATLNIDPDSLFRQFVPWFSQHINDFSTEPFYHKIFKDSTMYLDFFNNDYFFDQWQNELFDFNKELRQMDSLKRIFFDQFLKEEQMEEQKNGKTF